jgi:hypothetical protein
MKLLKIAAALALVAALGGCAEAQLIGRAVSYAADATVPPTVGIVAANTFDGFKAEVTDAEIDCTPHVVPISTQLPSALCAAQVGNIRILSAAVKAGTPLRNQIEPTAAGAVPVSGSVYNKLEAIIGTIQSTISIFNAAKG